MTMSVRSKSPMGRGQGVLGKFRFRVLEAKHTGPARHILMEFSRSLGQVKLQAPQMGSTSPISRYPGTGRLSLA